MTGTFAVDDGFIYRGSFVFLNERCRRGSGVRKRAQCMHVGML